MRINIIRDTFPLLDLLPLFHEYSVDHQDLVPGP
ncbi:Uncharacterised protein [Bordetella pertussis]|nr:Uncharacterised protein [Bordetella pertussis]